MIGEHEAKDEVKLPPCSKNFGKNKPILLQVFLNLIKASSCYIIDFLSHPFKTTSAGSLWKKKKMAVFNYFANASDCMSKPDRSLGEGICAWTSSLSLGSESDCFWGCGFLCIQIDPREHQGSSVCIGRLKTSFTFSKICKAHGYEWKYTLPYSFRVSQF